jgi:hypothetical protein
MGDKSNIMQDSSIQNQRYVTLPIITIPLSSITIYSSPLTNKNNTSIRLYFENVNNLPITTKKWKSLWKYHYLKYLWKRLKVDLITLNEIQINVDLLHQAHTVSDNLLQRNNYFTIMSHNKYELISSRQQEGVLTSANGEISQLLTESSCDASGLGR